MSVTKEQIEHGVIRFMQEEVIDKLPDASAKLMVGTIVQAVKRHPNMVTDYIDEHELLRTMLDSDGSEYELNDLFDSVSESIRDYGNLVVRLPKIPLLMPDERTLSFSSEDVHRLKT